MTGATGVRYGLVGAGYLGKALARSFAALPGASITAVFDPADAETVAAQFGARVELDWRALCAADDVDVVVIASPNWAHHEQAVEAAKNGKAVFCEKPVALSYAHASEMIDACSEAGVLFMAGHVTHFMSGVRRAKQLIADGTIGDLVFVRAIRNTWEGARSAVSWKKQRAASGGHLYHHIHELDLVQALLGPATIATMVGGNVAHHGPNDGDEEDLMLLSLEFAGSSFAALEYGSAFRWPEHFVLIQGTKGAIRLGMEGDGCELRTPERSERFLLHRSEEEEASRKSFYTQGDKDAATVFGTPDTDVPAWIGGIVEEETAYFHSLMQGGEVNSEFASLTDGSAALSSMAAADALTRSMDEGRKVAVSEILEGRGVGGA